MVNYNNGKIYKIEPICNHDEGDIYIGSTTKQYLSQRLVQHKSNYARYQAGIMYYVSSFDILENDNYIMSLIENVNCNTKDELLAREGYYIKSLECVNEKVMGRTKNNIISIKKNK